MNPNPPALSTSIRLARRPVGLPVAEDWSIVSEPAPMPAEGEVLVRTSLISLDPAMRGWLDDRPVMHGLAPELLRRYGANSAHEPLLAALINFAPGFVQSLATRVTRMMEQGAREGGGRGTLDLSGIGGLPDSCYMWRTGGCLTKRRQARKLEGD